MSSLNMEDGFFFIIIGIIALFYIVPPIWVLLSRRSNGGAKFGWFLVTLFFSWLGLAIFLIVTQALENMPKKQSSAFIKYGFQVSTALFVISFPLLFVMGPYLQSDTSPSFWVTFGYIALEVLTWPLKTLDRPLWMWPLNNLIQGYFLVLLLKIFMKMRARKNVAA